MAIALPAQKYADNHDVAAVAGQFVDRVRAIPQVQDAAMVDAPYSGDANTDGYLIEGPRRRRRGK